MVVTGAAVVGCRLITSGTSELARSWREFGASSGTSMATRTAFLNVSRVEPTFAAFSPPVIADANQLFQFRRLLGIVARRLDHALPALHPPPSALPERGGGVRGGDHRASLQWRVVRGQPRRRGDLPLLRPVYQCIWHELPNAWWEWPSPPLGPTTGSDPLYTYSSVFQVGTELQYCWGTDAKASCDAATKA